MAEVPLKKDVTHPYKRLQHLAGRYVLKSLFEDFPLDEIALADTHKPFLPGEQYHFSISHCGNFAAAIASTQKRVGIDIELETPRIKSIVPRFLGPDEIRFLSGWEHLTQFHLQMTTVLWSAKEAIYKWHGSRQMDFKKHMYLNGPVVYHSNEKIVLPFLFDQEEKVPLTLQARIFDPLVLAWVETEA